MALAKGCRTGLAVAALSLLAGLAAGGSAGAAPRRVFSVAPQPLASALLNFAVQANISIGVGEAAQCRGRSRGVEGAFTVSEALDQMLAASGCGYRIIDASSVLIVRAPAAPPAPRRPERLPPVARDAELPETRAVVPEVVVTATRRSALAIRLPDAISVISGDRMAMGRDSSLADLAGQAAGLTVTNLGPGSDKSIIRGLSDGGLTGHAQSTVGVYLDDTRLSYNAPDPDLRLTDIDQIEVLQGPQGALYGAGSIAGVVHIATRQPDLTQYGGAMSVLGTATNGGDPSGVVEAVVNVPLIPGELGLRTVAYAEQDGGYVNDGRIHLKHTNSTERTGARAALKLNINADWSLDFGLVHQTLASADSQYADPRLGPYNRSVGLPEPHDNNFDEFHVSLSGSVPLGQFKNTLSFVRHGIDTRYDASSALPLLIAQPVAPTAFDEADRIDTVVDEATLSSVGASAFHWLVGGFISDARQGLASDIGIEHTGAGPDSVIYSEKRTDSIQEYAVYGEASLDITPRLTAGVGARLGVTDVATRSIVRAPLDSAESAFSGHIADTQWEPKISLRYQIDDHLMAYALASEGARGGGFNTGGPIGTVFSGPGGTSEPFRRFKGDELWNFEAGVKLRALSDRLEARAVAFYALWNNIQSDQLLPSGLPYSANIGDGRNVGVELELAYAFGDFELRAASLIDEPELTEHTSPFPSLLHSGLPGAPRGSVGAAIRYQRHGGGRWRPFFDASVNYVGQSRLNFDERVSRRMGDYTVTKLTGGVDAGSWRIAAFVDNPLGVVGDTFAYGNPFTVRFMRQITPLAPTTGGLQITRTF